MVKKNDFDEKLQYELDKLGIEAKNVFIESEDNPDKYAEYPKIVVCDSDPQRYVYPILLKLEHSNILKFEALNNYVSTVLRLMDLLKWCTSLRLKRKRISVQERNNKKLLVNEFIIEKIPACRG